MTTYYTTKQKRQQLATTKNTTNNIQSKSNLFEKYSILQKPSIIVPLALIYGAYVALGFFIMTIYTSLVFAVFLGIIYYPLFSNYILKKPHTKNKKFLLHPAITLFLLMPLAFGLALYFFPSEEESGAISIFYPLHLLLTYSYSMTFLSLLVLIPMALQSKINQQKHSSLHYHARKNYNPSLSIIIPAYNEEKVIERTIKSVLDSNYPKKEIIIVNNNSTDDTTNILKKYANKIKIIHESKKGKAFAINSGIRSCHGDIVIVMDADTIVTKDAFKNIVQPFYKNPKLGAVSGNVKILNHNSNYHTKIQFLEYAMAFQISKAAQDSQKAVAIISGAFGAFRKSVIDLCSPFSNDTLTEDLDATITILKQGYTTSIQNDAIAYTEAPESLSDLIKQRTRWVRGMFQGYAKHPEMLRQVTFGNMHSRLVHFLLFNSQLFVPIISLLNVMAIIPMILFGFNTLGLLVLLPNVVVMSTVFALSLYLNKENLTHLKQLPLAFVYLRIHDFIFIKALFEHIFGRKADWNHLKRIGDGQ